MVGSQKNCWEAGSTIQTRGNGTQTRVDGHGVERRTQLIQVINEERGSVATMELGEQWTTLAETGKCGGWVPGAGG